MSRSGLSEEAILDLLREFPSLRERVVDLLVVVQNEGDDVKLADEAEMRVIEEIRRIGQEALQAWADRRVEKTAAAVREEGGVQGHGKKNSTGTPPSATSG